MAASSLHKNSEELTTLRLYDINISALETLIRYSKDQAPKICHLKEITWYKGLQLDC